MAEVMPMSGACSEHGYRINWRCDTCLLARRIHLLEEVADAAKAAMSQGGVAVTPELRIAMETLEEECRHSEDSK